ncbi:MAG: hypothetical protein IH942_07370 [Acidobacteria bacterium]|nr:hypothetical protein [Acidobacteriota bacterium]
MRDANRIDVVSRLDLKERYERSDLMIPDLLIATEGRIRVFYAPFDYKSPNARIALVGITPGWTQMEAAVRTFVSTIAAGGTEPAALDSVKKAAAFSGTLRTNLVSMLDQIGVPSRLGIETSAELFGAHADLLHPTSAIRYPVFRDEDNYAGTSPVLVKSPTLLSFVDTLLLQELNSPANTLVIPLGKAAKTAVSRLVTAGSVDGTRVLSGFPHPSGAYPRRAEVFEAGRASLRDAVDRWDYGP